MDPKPGFRVGDWDAVCVLWAGRGRMRLFWLWTCPRRSVFGHRNTIPLSENLPWSWCFPVWSEPRNSPLAVRSLCRGKKTKTRKGNSSGKEISETFKRERSQDVLCVTKCQRCHLKWTEGTVSLWNLLLLDLINFYCKKLWKHQQFVHFFASYKMTNSSGVL